MKCPTCVELDMTSRVYPGSTFTTTMATQSFYDEDGLYHRHDMNNRHTTYRCSNNHGWSEDTRAECGVAGCEWNER